MSEYKNTPAFPSHGSMGEVCQEGITLLDYMAGQALSKISTDDYSPKPETIAKLAYKIATAMLKEKERIESEQSK